MDAKLRRNCDQVGLVRFQEADHRGEQRRLADTSPKLVCPDSGQVDEPLRPTSVTERCRKRGKGKSCRIPSGVRWRIAEQSLTFSCKLVGN